MLDHAEYTAPTGVSRARSTTRIGEIIRRAQILPQVPFRITSEDSLMVVADLCLDVSYCEQRAGEKVRAVGGQAGRQAGRKAPSRG